MGSNGMCLSGLYELLDLLQVYISLSLEMWSGNYLLIVLILNDDAVFRIIFLFTFFM